LAGSGLGFFIGVLSVPAIRSGPNRVLPQGAFARMVLSAFGSLQAGCRALYLAQAIIAG